MKTLNIFYFGHLPYIIVFLLYPIWSKKRTNNENISLNTFMLLFISNPKLYKVRSILVYILNRKGNQPIYYKASLT